MSDGQESLGIMEQSVSTVWQIAPFILVAVAIWFVIAYFANTAIIRSATGARPLERKENKRVYNLVENLCMSQGMPMPKINLIEDNALNAFASGINNNTYTVSLSRGIINELDDEELEAVIAHELSHIRNRDVRLLIISIVFVGLFAMLTQIAFRILRYMPIRSRSNNKNNGGIMIILLIVLIVAAIGYFFARMMRFAISRKREYMADAGSAEMTRRPLALADALRKISRNPDIQAVTRDDIAQLFIEHPRKKETNNKLFSGISELFATHPSIEKRIAVLEGF
jgi:heat shock protein HtpX